MEREDYNKQKHYYTLKDCPFCTKLNKNKIIFESKYWFVMHNDNPYFGDNNGLMTFPKNHKEFTIELSKEELSNFIEVEKFMQNFYKDRQYFSFIRQSKSNKFVEHMHYHYLVGVPGTKVIDGKRFIKIKK